MSTHGDYLACGFCGRHLLRGEDAETFLDDGRPRQVCELCVPQALHAGWIRVGVGDTLTLAPQRGRGPWSLVAGMLRRIGDAGAWRRQPPREPREPWPDEPNRSAATAGSGAARARRPHRIEDEVAGLAPAEEPRPAPLADRVTTARGDRAEVTTSGARMAARAIDVFNHSHHPRTLAGIARSLGAPWVTVRRLEAARVQIVIAWEFTWYRFELDLAREADGVRATGRGTSLDDLAPPDVDPNAIADEHGYLYLRTGADTARV